MDLSNVHEKMAATGMFHFIEDGGAQRIQLLLPEGGILVQNKAPRRGSSAAPALLLCLKALS